MRAVDLLGSFTFLESFACDVCLRVLCLFGSGVCVLVCSCVCVCVCVCWSVLVSGM